MILSFYTTVNFAPETWSHPVEIYYAHAQSEGSTPSNKSTSKMVGSKRFIKSRSRVNTWTNRSRLSFSNKLFIFCSISSILFPAVASISQWMQGYHPRFFPTPFQSPASPTNTAFGLADDFTSKLSLLDCNLRLRIYEHVAGLRRVALSKKKQVRNLVGFLQGLAIIVFYALSFVVSIIALLVLLVTVCSTNPSSSHSPCTVSMISDMSELKNNAVVMFVVIMLMFQSVAFRCATGKCFPPSRLQLKKHRIKRLLGKTLVLLNIKLRLYEIAHMLLILSGDVELNPGPTPPSKKPEDSTDAGYGTDQPSVSVPSTPYLPPLSSASLSNFSAQYNLEPNDIPIASEADGNNVILDSSDTSAAVPDLPEQENIPLPGNTDYIPLLAQISSDFQQNNDYTGETSQQPSDVITQQPHTQVVEGHSDQGVISVEEHRSLLERKDYLIEDLKKQIREQQATINELEKHGHVHRWPEIQLHDLDSFYKELQTFVEAYLDLKTFKCKKGNGNVYCSNLKNLLEETMKKLAELDMWSERHGFESSRNTVNEQKLFFLIANQLLLQRQEFNYCPLCCCHKKERSLDGVSEYPTSHIWSKCLLTEFGEIHKTGVKAFIANMTNDPKVDSPGNMSLKMLCATCEKTPSKQERQLSEHYRVIMGNPNCHVPINNENDWMKFLFATFLIRGLFMNVNLVKELPNSDLFDALFDLLDYCNGRSRELKRKLYLFMLPNQAYKPKLQEFLYVFELQLRSPHFTSVVKFEHGSCLYTKFDCFHCVYPICKQCIDYLESEYDEHSMGSTYFPPSETCSTLMIPPSTLRSQLFPIFLLEENCECTKKLITRLIVNFTDSPKLGECIAFMKLGQSTAMEGRMLGYPKMSGSKRSNKLVYNLDSSSKYKFLAECTESARENSIIVQLPFGRIDPLKAIAYININHKLKKLQERQLVLGDRMCRSEEKIEELEEMAQPDHEQLNESQQESFSGYQQKPIIGLKEDFLKEVSEPYKDISAELIECKEKLKALSAREHT